MRCFGLIIMLAAVTFGSGCAKRITIDSVPSGAEVRIASVPVGRTPVVIHQSATTWYGGGIPVEVSKPGFRTVVGELDWRYDARHLYCLPFALLSPFTQLIHLHPRLHRQPLDHYTVILDEDFGEGLDDRGRLYGRLDDAVSAQAGTTEQASEVDASAGTDPGALNRRRGRR